MEFLSLESLEKFLSPKDIVTFTVIWFFVKSRVAEHFKSIENSLKTIGENIQSLKDSLVNLERNHNQKFQDLDTRVSQLEKKD